MVGAVLTSPFAFVVAMPFGTVGGSWGFDLLGPALGIPLGIVLAVAAAAAGILSVGAVVGGTIGLLLARFRRRA